MSTEDGGGREAWWREWEGASMEDIGRLHTAPSMSTYTSLPLILMYVVLVYQHSIATRRQLLDQVSETITHMIRVLIKDTQTPQETNL